MLDNAAVKMNLFSISQLASTKCCKLQHLVQVAVQLATVSMNESYKLMKETKTKQASPAFPGYYLPKKV